MERAVDFKALGCPTVPRAGAMNKRKKILSWIPTTPGATLNTSARDNLARLGALVRTSPEARLLNLGSGERVLGGEGLRREDYGKMVNLDLRRFPSVRVLGDAHVLPFREESFHGVICQAVLEHTRSPETVVREISRVLKAGGYVYAEAPFLQGFHPAPADFFRFTTQGLAQLFHGFMRIDSGVCVGPSSALSWVLREYLTGLLTGFSENQRLRKGAAVLSGWLTFPIKYLDIFFARRPVAHMVSSGVYFLGRKA